MKEQHGPIPFPLPRSQGEDVDHQCSESFSESFSQSFRNFDLIRRIDVGGMGEVYLARQRNAFDREVAIKIIRSDLVHDQIARQRFLREAEVTAHLLHEHILPLIEFGEEDGRLFLVTPYIEGGTLARRLQRGALTLTEAHQLFTALVKAVAYIHRKGVVHRDLKPSNVLLDTDNEDGQIYVRLIDFGIASLAGSQASPPLTTGQGEVGTAAYMAPERLDGISAPSNDIYSLGIILYQMFTGTLPSPEAQVTTIPLPIYDFIRRCTAVNPGDRYANADEVLAAFEEGYQEAIRIQPERRKSSSLLRPPLPESGESESKFSSSNSGHLADLQPKHNEVLVHRGEFVSSPLPGKLGTLRPEEYNAPTTRIDPQEVLQAKALRAQDVVVRSVPLAVPAKRKRSLVKTITTSMIVLLVVIALMGYTVFKTANTATIVLTPRTQAVSKVLTLYARPTITSVDPNSSSVPATVLSSTQTGTVTGQTTGLAGCVLGLFGCQRGVSFMDVDILAAQLRPTVRNEVSQDLQNKANTNQCTTVGNIVYMEDDPTANPPIGSPADTVTVSLTEQGSVECVKAQDVHSLALSELNQQLPRNYTLINQKTQLGQMVVRSVDGTGVVTLAVPAAGVAQYHLSDQELATIQNHISGMSLSAASSYIARQPGLDATGVSIHVNFGNTIPSDTTQIHITTSLPANLPPVQLPAVS